MPTLLFFGEAQGFGRPEEALLLTCSDSQGMIWTVGDPVQPVGASSCQAFRDWLQDLTNRKVGLAQKDINYQTPLTLRSTLGNLASSAAEKARQSAGTHPIALPAAYAIPSVCALAELLARLPGDQIPPPNYARNRNKR